MRTAWMLGMLCLALVVCIMPAYAQHAHAQTADSAKGNSDNIVSQPSYSEITDFRFTASGGSSNMFVGNDDLGPRRSYGFNLSLSSGHNTLVSYRFTAYNNSRVNLSGVDANSSVTSFGGTLPVSRKLKFRGVHNSWVEEGTDSTVQALGGYFDYRPTSSTRLEGGGEIFVGHALEYSYLMFQKGFTSMTVDVTQSSPDTSVSSRYLFCGYSNQYEQKEGVDHNLKNRIMLGGVIPFGPTRLGLGISHRVDSLVWSEETRAWTIAVGIPSSGDGTSISPDLYAKIAKKPGSFYGHAFGSFWGNELPDYVLNMMFNSGFRSLLFHTRVVNNQTFDIRAQNIHASERGVVGWYAGYFEFDLTPDLVSRSFELAAYYSFIDWAFVGGGYSYNETPTYNFEKHMLESPGHNQVILDVGGQRASTRLIGSVSLGNTGIERVSATGTWWF